MFFGIDLGTSNSAIVGYDAGAPRVFKTSEGLDVLPSALMLDRRGNMLVGKRAYDQAAYSPENVAQGFKRLMGTSSKISFASSDNTMTPEEASAEIIRALVSQATVALNQATIACAVVTIPAAFNQMQTEATMRAAKSAGIPKVGLLQEPIAAAMASIANANNKTGQFLVYDLGGGTFDAAIVQSIRGAATIVAHAGINMLGGRDFDRAILNSVVRPWLLDHFSLPEQYQADPRYQRLIRVAQHYCEVAKVALSTKETDRIFADEVQVGAKDLKGRDIFLDVELSRTELDALVVAEVERTIDLCRSLLRDNGYKPDDIDRVVMIGGPSRMPIVREKVGSELGIRLDTNTDPMTAVAMGAAIYAEGRDWSESGAEPAAKPNQPNETVGIRYDFPERTSDDHFRLRIRLDSNVRSTYRVVVDTEDGWTSGQVALADKAEIRGIPLRSVGENVLRATVLDESGKPIRDAEARLVVVRVLAKADGMPITHTIAVKIVRNTADGERNVLEPLVKKGTSLPATGMTRFRSALDLRANDGKVLEFELFEQAEGVDEPELNLQIGVFHLKSTDLDRGDVIRKGDDVFVRWSIDGNGILQAELEIPSIEKIYRTDRMYASSRGHVDFDGDAGAMFATEALGKASADLDSLEKALGAKVRRDVSILRERLNRQESALRLSNDADARRSASEEARLIRQDISRIRNSPEHIQSALRSEIDEFTEMFATDFGAICDPKITQQVHRLAGVARDALANQHHNAVEEARRSLQEMRGVVLAMLAKLPDFWVGIFEDLAKDRHRSVDKAKHDEFVRAAERCIRDKDIDGLRDVTFKMRDNMVRSADVTKPDVLAGLMK